MKVVRVTAAGALLDAEPILVSSSSSPPAVQYDGSDYLIVWFEPSSGPTQALAARFGRDGRFAAASADLLFSGPGLGVPVLASDGAGSSLLVYSVTDATGAGSLRARTLGAH
jgi:hypothetical protein